MIPKSISEQTGSTKADMKPDSADCAGDAALTPRSQSIFLEEAGWMPTGTIFQYKLPASGRPPLGWVIAHRPVLRKWPDDPGNPYQPELDDAASIVWIVKQ